VEALVRLELCAMVSQEHWLSSTLNFARLSRKMAISPEIPEKKKEKNTVSKKQEEDHSSQNANINDKRGCSTGTAPFFL
jgi:hypothetical protein